jgi:hypothetical protein
VTTYEFKCPRCGKSKLVMTMTHMVIEREFWFQSATDYDPGDEYDEETEETVISYRCAGSIFRDGESSFCNFEPPAGDYEELYAWAVRKGYVK